MVKKRSRAEAVENWVGRIAAEASPGAKENLKRRIAAAQQCWDVVSFEGLDARNSVSISGEELLVEEMIGEPAQIDMSEVIALRVGVEALEQGCSLRELLAWLYGVYGFTLKEAAERLGLSGERVRQLRNDFVKACRKHYGIGGDNEQEKDGRAE